MEVTIIVKEGLVQEVYAEDPSVCITVLDLDDEHTDLGEAEFKPIQILAEDARERLHQVW